MLMLSAVLLSCTKDTPKEWDYKYGFTTQDIIGEYTYSGVPDAFEGLTESEYFHLCQDATIDITYGGVLRFHINSPKFNYNKTFTGQPVEDDDNFLIHLTESQSANSQDVTAYVFTDKQGRIRLHGFARKTAYSIADDEYYKINYYFDVLKN